MENKINKKQKIINSNNILFVKNKIIFGFFTIINLFLQILSQNNKIILIIKGSGTRNIFSTSFEKIYYPNGAIINGVSIILDKYKYEFDEESNKVELIWNKAIDNCYKMFDNCKDIIEIDLSSFDTSQVTNMDNMFSYCSALISIELSNFVTSKVEKMNNMFIGCSSLKSLNLFNFDNSQVKEMTYMFSSCTSLISLNLSYFNTSQVTKMTRMFSGCSALISLDLSNFNIPYVTTIAYMFNGCSSLTSLNLSSFDTSKITNFNSIFEGCSSLNYLNLKNFDSSKLSSCTDIFKKVKNNITICINANNNQNITNQMKTSIKIYTIDCSDSWTLKKNIYDTKTDIYIQITDYPTKYQSENNKIISSIIYNTHMNNNECKELQKCLYCTKESLNKSLCVKCNINYYPKENDPLNDGENINCYNETEEGYYLDINNSIYKKCYYTCETCEMKGDNITHNCLKCKANYTNEINLNNYKNCFYKENNNKNPSTSGITTTYKVENTEKINGSYQYESIYTYKQESQISSELISSYQTQNHDENNFYIKYESSNIHKEEYPSSLEMIKTYNNNDFTEINKYTQIPKFEIEKQNYSQINYIKERIQNILKNETIKKDENKYYDIILETIESIITSNNFDTSSLEAGEDSFIDIDKMIITLTTTENQKNIKNNNLTAIYLEECETLLREHYNIPDDKLLYMKKIDVEQEKMKIPKIKFDVYCKLYETNLTKLNLSICEKSKISLFIPIEINENIDILNSSSEYYHDICYKSKSEKGTDIIINDRKIEFIEGNKTVCQENCSFAYYNYTTQKANCSCYIIESSSYKDMNINKTKLYDNFGRTNNKKSISNLDLTSCDVLSSKENIEKNTGFYLLLFILVAFIIIFIIFCVKGYESLENTMDKVIYKKFENKEKLGKTKIVNKQEIIKPSKNKRKTTKKTKKNIKKNSTIKSKNTKNSFINKTQNKKLFPKNTLSQFEDKINSTIKLKPPELKPDTDYERNWLTYEDAIRYDKRSSCDYYCSLLKYKQLFIFTFCSFNDYNSGIISKFIFFLSFALHYTVNALFFDDSNMHQIYEDEGKYNFGYQISHIIYSAIISNIILRLILHILVLTDKDILEVKIQPNETKAVNMKKTKLKCMKIKFAIFFLLNFILLVLFWYYLTCFNAIYRNTQFYLIKNTFISFGLTLLYPFIINFIPMIIRMYSIHSSKKDQRYFYKVSQIIQLI